jgi:hypothetical protein
LVIVKRHYYANLTMPTCKWDHKRGCHHEVPYTRPEGAGEGTPH